jgi:hypothetical protein
VKGLLSEFKFLLCDEDSLGQELRCSAYAFQKRSPKVTFAMFRVLYRACMF